MKKNKKLLVVLSGLASTLIPVSILSARCSNDSNSGSENGGKNSDGNSDMPHEEIRSENDERKRQEEEADRKQKEEKEKKDMQDVETVKQIVKEHEDAFGSFHTQGDFIEQISVYAKDKGINNLSLASHNEKNKNLRLDKEGGKQNTIRLQMGSQIFDVKLGKVLDNEVMTKYYFEGEQDKIFNNYLNDKKAVERNWRNILKDSRKIIVTQLGYYKSGPNIALTLIPYYTTKVPKHLPLKITSLLASFYNLESKKIDNLEFWDTKNIITFESAFEYAKNFDQDLSKWKLKDNANVKNIFKGAKQMNKHLENISKSWNKEKLTI